MKNQSEREKSFLIKAKKALDAATLEQIPNIGKAIADDLRGIGITRPDQVGRLITDALDSGKIKLANPTASRRDFHYLPYWA